MMKLYIFETKTYRNMMVTLSWNTAGSVIELQSCLGQSGSPLLTLLKLNHVFDSFFCTLNWENKIIAGLQNINQDIRSEAV